MGQIMNIFVTGAGGYVGGSLAARWLGLGHDVRGLVRTERKADALRRRGITPIIGDLEDHELLASETARSDVTVNAASSLHLGAARAIVAGARRGHTRILHTSGVGLITQDVEGMSPPATVQNDDDPVVVGPHPMQALLREVENVFLTAADEGKHTVVVSNAMIYGAGSGLKRDSIQLPLLARAASEHGFVSVVGAGVNRWSTIHIADVVELIVTAVERAPAGSFYFAEAAAASFGDIAAAVARRLGVTTRMQPLSAASAVYGEMPARYLLGTNGVVSGRRARRELGWSPSCISIIDWIETEMAVGPQPEDEAR
jgi:nucleoside-diphosphate-sugar epimerase